MPERKNIYKNDKIKYQKIGILFQSKRLSINRGSRKEFIEERNQHLFNDSGREWISERYLINIENGNNLPSIEMLIKLSFALEIEPGELFNEIYKILCYK